MFHEYMLAKIIFANRVLIEHEVLDYIIDDILVESLRDQAHIGRFTSKPSLLRAFKKVNLREKILECYEEMEMASGNRR